jgi:O-antigen ligase
MTFVLPTVATLVVLLILPGWSFYYDVTPKIVVAALGAALVLLFPPVVPSPLPRHLKWFGILAACEAGALLLATAFSSHGRTSLLGSTWRREGLFAELAVLVLAVAAALDVAAGAHRLRIYLRIMVLAAVPAAIYGIAQYFGIDPWIASSGYHSGEGLFTIVRPPSTLGHAAYFATYLLFPVFGGAALAVSETSRTWKTAAILASLLAVFAIVLSGTRAALAGLLLGALFVAMKRRMNWRWMAGAVAMLALLAGFYISPAGGALRARAHWSGEDPLGGSRPLLWRDTLRMSQERWLTGFGPETFTLEFPRHESIELARAYPDFYHESPHNIFLDALVSNGIVGLLSLLAITVFGLMLADGLMGGALVAILASQQFTAFTLPTELYFLLCLAFLVAGESAFHDADVLEPAARNPWRLRPVLALPFAAFAVYLGAGDYLLASARRALDQLDTDRAIHSLTEARRWNATADIYFSRRFLNAHVVNFAMDCALRAPETADDRQNALVNLAAFYAAAGGAQEVENRLREAIAAAPNWFKPHWLLAQVLSREGRAGEAETEAVAALDRDGGKVPEVAEVMQKLRRR